MAIYQIFVKLLDGDTRCLRVPTPTISGEALKLRLSSITSIPPRFQRLLTGTRLVYDETLISASQDRAFPSLTLLLRLPGGKGGFGSLLRGAATKAGQKKTNNFDACRDMSGRRLRHVNAEKRLEEWKAGAEERRLEKVAEEFLKKKAKEVKRRNSKAVEKYVEKYKEQSEKCMGEVEEAVRDSFRLYEEGKRKALPATGPVSKRLKLWLGKNKLDESDSEDEDDESDGEDGKSMIVDELNQKDDAGSSGTVSGGQSDGESSGGASDGSNSEEEKRHYDLSGSSDLEKESGSSDSNVDAVEFAEPGVHTDGESNAGVGGLISEVGGSADGDGASRNEGAAASELLFQEQVDSPMPSTCSESFPTSENANLIVGPPVGLNEVTEPSPADSCPDNPISDKAILTKEDLIQHEAIANVVNTCQSSLAANCEEPLNFDKYSSASELEVLGMEMLKSELQANGLKCGGTLQERAARLFLLKTIPVDKLPKKVLAKPTGSSK